MRKGQDRSVSEVQSKENKATNGCGVEGAGVEKAGGIE